MPVKILLPLHQSDCREANFTFRVCNVLLRYFRCPVDPVIFPRFSQVGDALESSYEAFRFTESYGVIFQCNVKYCVGRCEPVSVFWFSTNYQVLGYWILFHLHTAVFLKLFFICPENIHWLCDSDIYVYIYISFKTCKHNFNKKKATFNEKFFIVINLKSL